MQRVQITIAITALAAVTIAFGDTIERSDGRYTWDPHAWRWNKKECDSPPMPAGGYEAFVRQLRYPSALQSLRMGGAGVAIVAFDASGRVQSITYSPHMAPQLEYIVTGAIHNTRFLPARRRGKPVPATVGIPVTFVAPGSR